MAVVNIAPPLPLWKGYKYFPGGHIYQDSCFDHSGGPDGRPCVWADDTLWSIDTPEQPPSILYFIHYRSWNKELPVDLRDAQLRFRLRGDGLRLHGAHCYFWVVTEITTSTRWHFVQQPIPIAEGSWGEEMVLRLVPDPSQWHCSFVSKPERHQPVGLAATLASCFSYGFSFVGFSEKVTGRIGLADFQIFAEIDTAWPFVFNGDTGKGDEWLTVSRTRIRQEPINAPARLVDGFSALTGSAGAGLYVAGDYLPMKGDVFSFVYLAMVKAALTTGGRDLRHALLLVRQSAEEFDAKGGQICFFVEHAASGTRWVLNVIGDTAVNKLTWVTLAPRSNSWVRISGTLPLEDVLAGNSSASGYDYFGIMLVDCKGEPHGTWGLIQFSLGPTLESEPVIS